VTKFIFSIIFAVVPSGVL